MKQTIILGIGKTGQSCARYLKRLNQSFLVMDSRNNPAELFDFKKEFPDVSLYLGRFDTALLTQAQRLIVSPGISLEESFIVQARLQGIEIVGDIELFSRAAKAPIIAITGTNAKGTVTTLVGEIAKNSGLNVRVGGNIGVPALDLLEKNEPDLYVLEISSFQLETVISFHSKVATILNVTPDHLDRHHTLEAYVEAKQRIYQRAENIVWNREDAHTKPVSSSSAQISFGLSEPKNNEWGIRQVTDQFWLAWGEKNLLSVNELKIKGRHNWMNALAALAIAHTMQWPMEQVLQTLRTFKGLEHRCEWVAEHDGVSWYNDSKGTNVGATLAAINGLGSAGSGKIILIAGGVGKDADFSVLQTAVRDHVRAMVLMGRDAHLMEQALLGTTAIQKTNTLSDAVAIAAKIAVAGDVVLLSPACASWDMFHDFEERGQVFKKTVREMLS